MHNFIPDSTECDMMLDLYKIYINTRCLIIVHKWKAMLQDGRHLTPNLNQFRIESFLKETSEM